ncbi:hypothetical protein N0V82_000315 [Gnomoniopsis sp. IMI 355080]|nr:hypothetical protein N0V82_000315 [Gnomoniopsis sp. IMI 355080]
MRPSHVTTLILSLTPLAAAFPWPRWLPELEAMVVRRQDDTSTSAATATQTATSEVSSTGTDLNTADDTATSSGTAKTTGTGTVTSSATGTGSSTDDASASGTGTATDDGNSTTTADSNGSAVMKYPVTTLTSALYKIGDYVTFKWNYTELTAKPTAVNVIASASTSSLGASTWTLTSNMTFETEAAFTWDTAAFQTQALQDQKPLLVEMYTLYIYDAESAAPTATAGYGSLTGNAALTFGLYTGQPYTPLASGWVCGTCSAALSSNERQALGLLFTMFGVTVLSFTWFVTGLW